MKFVISDFLFADREIDLFGDYVCRFSKFCSELKKINILVKNLKFSLKIVKNQPESIWVDTVELQFGIQLSSARSRAKFNEKLQFSLRNVIEIVLAG